MRVTLSRRRFSSYINRGCLCENWKPSFLLLLIFDWCTFSRRVTAPWRRQSAKKQVSTNQNSRNRWCLIVRRTIWTTPLICKANQWTDFFMIRTSLMNELRFIQRIHRVNWIISKSDPYTPNKLFYLLQWKPFRTDDKCFLFHLKRFFCSQDI